MSISQIISQLRLIYPEPSQARQVYFWLLEKLLKTPTAQLLSQRDLQLSLAQIKILQDWINQLVGEHKPLAYILGNVPFLDLDILVEPPNLIPRLETEWWVHVLIQQLSWLKDADLKILDLCTGSGCIGLALAKFFPNSQVTAIDISPAACDLVAKNVVHNQLSNVLVLQSDLYQKIGIAQKFDLIVANPPYIPAQAYENLDLSVRLWEDPRALVAPGSDLQIITKIIKLAPKYLQKKYDNLSQLWVEIDATQGKQAYDLMQLNFRGVELLVDQFDRQRVIVGKI